MTGTVEFYEQVLSAFPDAESLTVVTVAGMTREQVLAQLGADLSGPVQDGWEDDEESTAWAAVDVPGGVVAVELTGYGDPSCDDLAALSREGASAVVRGNIQGHYRFGCAQAGELLWNDDEFVYVSDRSAVPAQIRSLFDAAWVGLDDGDDEADPLSTGLAMAEVVTDVTVDAEQVTDLLASGFFRAASMRYSPAEREEAVPIQREQESPWITAADGAYAIGGDFPGTFSDPPTVWPETILAVAVDPGAAWVRKVSTGRHARITPVVVYADREPIELLAQAGDDYVQQASLVLAPTLGDALRVYDAWSERVHLTPGGDAVVQVRIFARLPDEVRDYEEHLLVLWPDPSAQPDVRR